MSLFNSFTLTQEQASIREMARDFVEKDLTPVIKQLEYAKEDDWATLKTVWGRMAELGFTGLVFPEEYGGSNIDSLAYFLVLEEIAKVSSAVATSLSVHNSLVGLPILYNGTQEQKDKYLPGLISGQTVGGFALTEPNAGSDAGSGLTKAEKNGTGYILNGSKLFITNALIAGVFIATARTDKNTPGAKGLSAFILEPDMAGLNIQEGDEKMGLWGSDWGELHFDNCHVPTENRLSEEGRGFKLFMESLNVGRISIASISLGIAEACLEASLAYSKERKQFGEPICNFQAIQFKLADMAMQIEAARALVYNAARLRGAGQTFAKEASMAKLYASELANVCAKEAVQIFGGYGYTRDFPVERYFRDARVMSLFEGTSEIQRTIISRHVLA